MAYDSLEETIRAYALAPFSVDKGPRRDLILRDLKEIGLSPALDLVGNIIVERGSGDRTMVLSSHMDTVFGLSPRAHRISFETHKGLRRMTGTLDNCLGCVVNFELARLSLPSCRTIFAFTVAEEPIEYDVPLGAIGIAESLMERGIKPEACIVLDVTFPSSPGRMEKLCYAENFSDPDLRRRFDGFLDKQGITSAVSRTLPCWDETKIYGARFPAFAFGPAVRGNLHSAGACAYVESVSAQIDILNRLLGTTLD